MHTRTLGQGLRVSAIGYGCMGLSHGYANQPDRKEGKHSAQSRCVISYSAA
jgi:aryl-alcohol dehydrogenase-like predicted oxidoreductase